MHSPQLMNQCRIAVCCMIAWLALAACTEAPITPADPELAITLRWVRAYPQETRARVETGLMWTLSYLGARLPREVAFMHWRADQVTVDLSAAGVIEASYPAWRRLLAELKSSEEYREFGALDIGRFVALTLGSSRHYFALTDAPRTYAEFRSKYTFERRQAAIIQSVIARGNRLVDIGAPGTPFAFVAFEGTGTLADGTFAQREIETIDLMRNGQLRFALYDLDGRLKDAGSIELTQAGKPAKCLWCHEVRLQQTFHHATNLPGYYSSGEFDAAIAARQRAIAAYRTTLSSSIDFVREQDHTLAELLYLSFMEPSAQRLAAEWGITVSDARRRLKGRPVHAHLEHPILGDEVYRRTDVDALGPRKAIAVPTDLREPSAYEPDLMHDAMPNVLH